MKLHFDYLPYRRNLRRPLSTAHGKWTVREGIVIRLELDRQLLGFGEIAPVPWFGSETFDEALVWCQRHGKGEGNLNSPARELPCCGWALASAMGLFSGDSNPRAFSVAALVDSTEALEEKQAAGYHTFKTKMGVLSAAREMKQFESWFDLLDVGRQLRLDANGALSETAFNAWLEFLEGKPVEYLEQPLPPGLENRMLEMAEPFSTPLALDESVAGMESLSRWWNWPGPLVVKPSLLGNPEGDIPQNTVGSSVFETSFGIEAGLRFLARTQKADTAIGYDTSSFFASDGWTIHRPGPILEAGRIGLDELQRLWEAKSRA